ncbi:MAG: CGP-CTERM sorting domain-containing protein [Burkholderiales bacterium]|nr:CGP-CTERM sorting domain-containing protein [Burkholderiales bacterium]
MSNSTCGPAAIATPAAIPIVIKKDAAPAQI